MSRKKIAPWLPVNRNIEQFLPQNTQYTKAEAYIDIAIHYHYQLQISIKYLSRRWRWGFRRVKSFLDEIGFLPSQAQPDTVTDTANDTAKNEYMLINFNELQEPMPKNDTVTDTATDTAKSLHHNLNNIYKTYNERINPVHQDWNAARLNLIAAQQSRTPEQLLEAIDAYAEEVDRMGRSRRYRKGCAGFFDPDKKPYLQYISRKRTTGAYAIL